MSNTGTIFALNRRSDCDYTENPTLEVILATANNKEALQKRPMIFHGIVPQVTQPLPHGIEFTKMEDGTWLMLA